MFKRICLLDWLMQFKYLLTWTICTNNCTSLRFISTVKLQNIKSFTKKSFFFEFCYQEFEVDFDKSFLQQEVGATHLCI